MASSVSWFGSADRRAPTCLLGSQCRHSKASLPRVRHGGAKCPGVLVSGFRGKLTISYKRTVQHDTID